MVILDVNTTYQDDLGKVVQFVQDQGIAYPVLLDTAAEVAQKYPARLMPTTYIIDRAGKIVHTKVGDVDEAALDGQVAQILNTKQIAP